MAPSIAGRAQTACRAFSAAEAPRVAMAAITEITGVCLGEKNIDQGVATHLVCKGESRRLVDPHQRRMDDELPIGT